MKKIPFTQKNDLIVKHKNKDYFWKDLELFKKHLGLHPLNNDLARANVHSYEKLDGNMLNALLDVITIAEILENRGLIEKEPRTLDQLKSLIVGFNILNFINPDTFYIIGEEKLEELNTLEDDDLIKNFIDNLLNPKACTIDEIKEAFVENDLNIEGVSDSFFEDLIGKPLTDLPELILNKYAFMKKPEVIVPAGDNPIIEEKPVIENAGTISDEAKAGQRTDGAGTLQGLNVSHVLIDEMKPEEKQQQSVSDVIVETPSPVVTTKSSDKKKGKSKKNSRK